MTAAHLAATVSLPDFWNPELTMDLLGRSFVQYAVWSLALLALLGGLIGPFIVSRQMSFAVHGSSELSFTGAAFALLVGFSVNTGAVIGAVVAAAAFGLMGRRTSERDSVIGVILAFGLGLGILFMHLYGRSGPALALLTGQAASITADGLNSVIWTTVVVAAVLAVVYRPLLFATHDPVGAQAAGVPMRLLSVIFAVLIGLVAAQSVQIVGALLVMSLLITPAAAAARLSANPTVVLVLAVVFAEIAAVGGVILSLAPGLPVSVLVTSISFAIYVLARLFGLRPRNYT